MKNIQYLDIFKRALLMTWRNKFLWFFGLIIFLGTLASNLNWDAGTISRKNGQFFVVSNFANHPRLSMACLVVFIAIVVFFFLMKFIGTAATIKSANNISVYRQVKISKILSEAKNYLWLMLLLEILINLGVFVVILALLVPVAYLFALRADILAFIWLIFAILLVVPLALLAYFLRRYSYFYLVLGNLKLKLSLEAAYSLLRKNIWESLIMGSLAIVAGIIMLIAVLVCLLLLSAIMAPFGLVLYLIFSGTGITIILIAGAIIGTAVLLLAFAWYTSFMQTAWVLFFQEISLEKKDEKKPLENLEIDKIPTPEAV